MMNRDDVELVLTLDDVIHDRMIVRENGMVLLEMANAFVGSSYDLPWRPLRECVEEWYDKEWRPNHGE